MGLKNSGRNWEGVRFWENHAKELSLYLSHKNKKDVRSRRNLVTNLYLRARYADRINLHCVKREREGGNNKEFSFH